MNSGVHRVASSRKGFSAVSTSADRRGWSVACGSTGTTSAGEGDVDENADTGVEPGGILVRGEEEAMRRWDVSRFGGKCMKDLTDNHQEG